MSTIADREEEIKAEGSRNSKGQPKMWLFAHRLLLLMLLTNYDSSAAALAFDDVAGIIYAHSGAAGNGDRGLKLKFESNWGLPFMERNKPSARKKFL